MNADVPKGDAAWPPMSVARACRGHQHRVAGCDLEGANIHSVTSENDRFRSREHA